MAAVRLGRRIAASRDQEERGARLHGGQRVAGSGSGPVKKGDVRCEADLIEYKRTDKSQIVLKLLDLEKIRGEALRRGRTALMGIEIGGRDYVLREAVDDRARDERVAELEAEVAGLRRDRAGDDPALHGGVAATT